MLLPDWPNGNSAGGAAPARLRGFDLGVVGLLRLLVWAALLGLPPTSFLAVTLYRSKTEAAVRIEMA